MQLGPSQEDRIRAFGPKPNRLGRFLHKLYAIVKQGESAGVQARFDRQGFTITNQLLFKNMTLRQYYKHNNLNRFIKYLDDFWFVQRKDLDPPNRSFSAIHFDLDKPKYRVRSKKRTKSNEESKYWPVQIVMKNTVEDYDYDPLLRPDEKKVDDSSACQSPTLSEDDEDFSQHSVPFFTNQGPLNNLHQEFNDDPETKKMLENLGEIQVEQEMLEAQVQFLKDSNANKKIDLEQIIASDRSPTFKMFYIQTMQKYLLKEFSRFMEFINAEGVKKHHHQQYFEGYRHVHPSTSSIDHRKVTKETTENYQNLNFAPDALELKHSANRVDFDYFFKFDWKQFEIMRFNNCQLETSDWTKFCTHAKENLPNLKQIHLKANTIKFLRQSDFQQFPSLRRIDFTDNEINPVCQKEIQAFATKNRSVIIKRD